MPCIFKLGGCEEIIEVLPTNNNFPTELRIDFSEKNHSPMTCPRDAKGYILMEGRNNSMSLNPT